MPANFQHITIGKAVLRKLAEQHVEGVTLPEDNPSDEEESDEEWRWS
jgi:hypothetical protein